MHIFFLVKTGFDVAAKTTALLWELFCIVTALGFPCFDLPERFGNPLNIYKPLSRWMKMRCLGTVVAFLATKVVKQSFGGLSTKIRILFDVFGNPGAFSLSGGQAYYLAGPRLIARHAG